MTGAPWRFAVVDDEPDVAAGAADDVDVLEPLLEQAAVASATQARPTAKRGHLLVAIIISPRRMPGVGTLTLDCFRTLICENYFRALYSSDVRTSMDWGTLLSAICSLAGTGPARSRSLLRMSLGHGTRADVGHQY